MTSRGLGQFEDVDGLRCVELFAVVVTCASSTKSSGPPGDRRGVPLRLPPKRSTAEVSASGATMGQLDPWLAEWACPQT